VQAFTPLRAVAAPIDLPNVDTDRIIPARYLRKPRDASGYADFLFHDVRYEGERPRPDFILNQPAFRAAKILVAAENFGCGSSREAAVWALDAAGFRVVIAPSLGDIFHQNCFKVGVLPVILPAETAARLRAQLHGSPGAALDVDLSAQTVTGPDGDVHRFEVDPFRKQMLLTGQDEIGLTLGYEGQIREFEARHRAAMPWLVPAPPSA
jgi:3-isopropylmalate/(R)-2-methylmalate dehydratase small subunit